MSTLSQGTIDKILADAIATVDTSNPTAHSVNPDTAIVPHTKISGYTYLVVTKLGTALDPETSQPLAVLGVQVPTNTITNHGGVTQYWVAVAGTNLSDGEVAILRLSKQTIARSSYFYTMDSTGCTLTRLTDIDEATRANAVYTLLDKIYDVDITTGVPRTKKSASFDAGWAEKGFTPKESYNALPSTILVNIPTGSRSTPTAQHDPGINIPDGTISTLNKPRALSDLDLATTVENNSQSQILQQQTQEEEDDRCYEEQPWLAPPIPYLNSTSEVLSSVWHTDYMRLGYAALEIPPEQIFYVKDMPDKVIQLLRADGTLKTSYGVSADNFQIHLTFDDPQTANKTLLPIVRQYLRTPFIPVVNDLFNQTYGTHALAITGIQVSTAPQYPGEIDVVIQADKFNYQAYMPGEPTLDSTICYPLLKLWAEHDTPTRPLPIELDGAFEMYIPNKGYLEAMDAALDEQAQRETNWDLQRNGLDPVAQAGPDSYLYTDASSCARAITDLREDRSITTFPNTPVRDSVYLPNCLVVTHKRETALAKRAGHELTVRDAQSAPGARAIINVANPAIFRDIVTFLADVDAVMGSTPLLDVQGPLGDAILEPAIIEGELTITATSGLGNFTVNVNGNMMTALVQSAMVGGENAFTDEELSEVLKHVYVVLRKQWLEVSPKLTNELLAKLAGYTMQDPANLPDELNEPVWDKVVLPSFTIEQITVGMESVLALHTPRSNSGAVHQFLGRNDTHVVISGIINNENDLELLRNMLERQEELVRAYNGNMLGTRKYGGYMLLKNEVCRLLGVTHVLPSNVSVQSLPDYPGAHNVQISFVQYNPSQEKREAIQEYEATLWDKTGNPTQTDTGLGLEKRTDSLPLFALRAEKLNDRLRTIELYPDMHLPTYEDLRSWIGTLLQENEDTRDDQLEELGVDSSEFMWTHEDCAMFRHPYYRVPDRTGFVDPDFCFAPSFPHSGDFINGLLQTMSGNSNLPTVTNSEAGIAPTRSTLRIVGQDADDVRDVNFFDVSNPVYVQDAATPSTATFIEARDDAAADAALKDYNDLATRVLVPVKSDNPDSGSTKYEVVDLEKMTNLANWQTGITQEHLNLIKKTASELGIPEVVALLLFKSEGGLNDADTSDDSIGLGQMQLNTFIMTTTNKYGYTWPFGPVPDLSSKTAKIAWGKQRLEPKKAIWASLVNYKMKRMDLETVWCTNNGTSRKDITPDVDRLMWQCTEMLYRLPSQLSVLKKDKKMTLPAFYDYLYTHTSSSFQRRAKNVGAALKTAGTSDVLSNSTDKPTSEQKGEKHRVYFDLVVVNTKSGAVHKHPVSSVSHTTDKAHRDATSLTLGITGVDKKMHYYTIAPSERELQLVKNSISEMVAPMGHRYPKPTGATLPFSVTTPISIISSYLFTDPSKDLKAKLEHLMFLVDPATSVPTKITADNASNFFDSLDGAIATDTFMKNMSSTKKDADDEWARVHNGYRNTSNERAAYTPGAVTRDVPTTGQGVEETLSGTGPQYYTMQEMFIRENPDRAYLHQDMFHDMRRYSMGNRLLNAYPSFLVLLVDGGKWMRMWRLYDYIYGMSCVESIDVFKSRKTPVDVATLKLSNMYGRLATEKSFSPQGRKWQWSLAEVTGAAQRLWSSFAGGFTTEMKQAWARSRLGIMLRPGVRLHIRMGYGADGTRLPIVFNGAISEVEPGQDEMEVVALGDGQELEHQMTAEGETWKKHGFFGAPTSTHDIITTIMAPHSMIQATTWGNYGADNPWGIEHFGSRHVGFWHQNIAEIGMNIYAATANSLGCDRAFARQNTWLQGLQQLNILPGYGIFDDTKIKFDIGVNMDAADPWSVITLCRKSVPGFIAAVHPFGLRSTLFYGKPYWPIRYDYKRGVVSRNATADIGTGLTVSPKDKNLDDITMWKPFCQVHVISSVTNLLDNRITANSEDLFTQCQAEGSFNGTITADNSEEWSDLMYLDSDILPEYQKKIFVRSGMYATRWAKTTDMIKGISFEFWRPRYPLNCYAVNSLRDSVMDMYQGAAVIIGDSSIKPHDVVFLADLVSEMSGVFYVKEVTHHISTDTGFTSTVCPDLSASVAELADDATHCWVAMFGQKYVGNLALQSTIGNYLSSQLSPAPLMVKLLGKLTKMDDKLTAGLGAQIVEIVKELEPRSKVTKAVDGIYNKLLTRGTSGTDDAVQAIADIESEIQELRSSDTPTYAKRLKALIKQKKILQREMAVHIDSITGSAAAQEAAGARASVDRLIAAAQESLSLEQSGIAAAEADIVARMQGLARGSREWKVLDEELKALQAIAKEDFGFTTLLQRGKRGWKLTSALLRAGRYTNRLAGAASLAEAKTILQELNVATVLGPRAASMAKIGPQLLVFIVADNIVGWLNRKMAARQTLVLRPLNLSGRELTAGIDGHLGCVAGDPVGFWDGVLQSMFCWKHVLPQQQPTTAGGWVYQGGATLLKGLLNTVGMLLGFQGVDYGQNVPSDDLHNYVFGNAGLTPADMQARRAELERWYREVRGGEIDAIEGSTSVSGTAAEILGKGGNISSYKGTPVYVRGVPKGGGKTFQCVDFIKDFYKTAMHVDTSSWHGNGRDYYGSWRAKGLKPHPNGGTIAPKEDDILCWDGGPYGHVAIVKSVNLEAGTVEIVESNWSSTKTTAVLRIQTTMSNGQTRYTMPNRGRFATQGWLRL